MTDNKLLMEILPIFEIKMEHGEECVYYLDKNLSHSPLFVEFWDDEIEIYPLVPPKLSVGFTFKMVYYIESGVGRFITALDYIIPEESCIGLYKHHIEVEGAKLINGKNVYDKVMIQRKATLRELIND